VVLPCAGIGGQANGIANRLDLDQSASIRQATLYLVGEVGESRALLRRLNWTTKHLCACDARNARGDRGVCCAMSARDPRREIAAMLRRRAENDDMCAEYVSVEKLAIEYLDMV